MRNPWRWATGALFSFVVGVLVLLIPVEAYEELPAQEPARPKLVVLVVFDQMRADYLKKWQPLFGDGGFKRLQTEGAYYTNCHYPYAFTLTAAGHTSLVTGTTPSVHGIIANDWWDRTNGEAVASTTPLPAEEAKGEGPYRRKVETVGDVLIRMLMGRVVSLSIKSRSAILMAALRANLCYWFSSTTGNFKTSRYYGEEPHAWVTKFNKTKIADKWLDKTWDRFDKNVDYAKHSGPDDFISEGTGFLQGQTFPHPFKLAMTKDEKENKQNYYDAVTCSPMGNELLLNFAKAAIINEKLGQTDKVDLLCLSFSCNDIVGHTWGPDSQEVLDITLRSDALVKDLLQFLDAKVGKGNYYFAMSADHGVCPLPEFAKKEGKDAGRIDPEVFVSLAEEFLNKKFLAEGQKAPWLEHPKKGNPWLYLNYATIKELKLKNEIVENALAKWFEEQPGIERAFTRTQMMNEKSDSELFKSVKLSFHPDVSGDVMVIIKPYHLISPTNLSKNPDKWPNYRTSHGTPHPYDTHVPLLVIGPRIQPGERDQLVRPQIMASILSEALGIERPKNASYSLPEGLFKR